MTKTCEIGDEITAAFNKFKVGKAKENSAMILKINVKELKVEIEETIGDNADILDIADSLPESVPRYVILSYKWKKDDGRLTYPLIFLYYIPPQIKPSLAMLYSSTKHELGVKINVNKTVEIQNADMLTDEWILAKLNKA
eukprot:TRINITY_DN2031_c0_g1_i1.p2 TRINITY_DN2031_c0_g1~~TRINITY_DN2031_c0_g1_i1.p2  ORF type:complete len:154 (+),score=49.97 TRINITY_DN2031_c0_g1_i1:45-464(+)